MPAQCSIEAPVTCPGTGGERVEVAEMLPCEARALIALSVLVVLAVVAPYRYRARRAQPPSLAFEPPALRYGLRGGGLVLALYVVLLVAAPHLVGWTLVEVPLGVRRVAAAFTLLVLPPLVAWTQGHLGRNVSTTVITHPDHELVTTGPYRWVRHPLYTLGFLWYLSLSVLAGSWLLGLLAALALALVSARLPLEERHLEERFGDEYRAWRRRTGMFFPRLPPGPVEDFA